MNIKLLRGRFSLADAKDLITKLVNTKIQYQENKIHSGELHNEEDIEMRERRIIELQNDLKKILARVDSAHSSVELTATIELSEKADF